MKSKLSLILFACLFLLTKQAVGQCVLNANPTGGATQCGNICGGQAPAANCDNCKEYTVTTSDGSTITDIHITYAGTGTPFCFSICGISTGNAAVWGQTRTNCGGGSVVLSGAATTSVTFSICTAGIGITYNINTTSGGGGAGCGGTTVTL